MRRLPALARLSVVVSLATAATVGCATSGTNSSDTEDTTTTTPMTTAATPVKGADIVAAADRTEADRALDDGRQPAAFIDFLQLQPGMHVADLGAGGGYTTELLARAVGPTGVVYGQNTPFILERFAQKPWSERVARPVNQHVKGITTEFSQPLPDELAGTLDAVVNVLFYHDSVWMETDRAAMNANIFASLKPGGIYVIVDHSGGGGTGTSEARTLHRIEEQVVRDEVMGAGFELVDEGMFLRNPDDTRDWNAAPGAAAEKRGTSDRFVLKFQKPAAEH